MEITSKQKLQLECSKYIACTYFNVKESDIDGDSRVAHFVRARHSCIWILLYHFNWRSRDLCVAFDMNHKMVNHIDCKFNNMFKGTDYPSRQAPLHKEDVIEYTKLVKELLCQKINQ